MVLESPRLRTAVALAALGALLLAGPRPAAAQPLSVQEVLLRAKPAVVLIIAEVAAEVTLNCGSGPVTAAPPPFRETGTGWFIDAGGWIITNGHVVQPAHQPPAWLVNQQAQRAVTSACLPRALGAAGLEPGQRPDAEEALKRRLLDQVLPTAKVKLTPQVVVQLSNGQRFKAAVHKYSPPVSGAPGAMSGRDLALLKIDGRDFPVLPLADSRAAQIGDPIHILGFPGVVLSHELLNQSSSREASVTNGAVSGFKEDVANLPVIQTDAPASWGNSGGPAVTHKGGVLGVLTFVSLAPGAEGAIVQGFNFIIPSAAVRDFVAGTPVQPTGRSAFNDAWFAGLREFFTEDWPGAARQFGQAEKLLPGLPDVKRMLAEAQDKVKNPPPRPFPWFWVAIGVTVLSAGGYGAQFGRRWYKNRYRVQPSEVIRLLEAGKAPLIVDVRRPEVYDTLPLRIPGSVRIPPGEIASAVKDLDLDVTRPVVAYCT
jgi:S1-C subfamily serine protease